MNPFSYIKKTYDIWKFNRAIRRWQNVKTDQLKLAAPRIITRLKWLKRMRMSLALGLILIITSGCILRKSVQQTPQDYRTMSIEQITDHLRKDYSGLTCPQKSDRLMISEEVWQQIDWTDEEKYRNAALPHKMWNMRHDDHGWPGCRQWRGDDAKGPRAGEGHDKYFPPLPTVIVGRGIARWMAQGDVSILEIPLFKDYSVTYTSSTIPATLDVVERRHGHIDYGREYTITKEFLLAHYAPSPLQKFSDKSYLETYPPHKSYHIMIEKNETYTGKPNGPDKVYFWRHGWRWDSFDNYYIKGAKYIGGHWN